MATTYAMFNAQDRGRLFVTPGTQVYEGMIVGRTARDEDLAVNIAKKKHLTNHRAASGEELIHLDVPIQMSLDDAIEYIAADELVEVTPKSLRLRKRILNTEDRRKATKTRQMDNGG